MRNSLRVGALLIVFCALGVQASAVGQPVTAPADFGPGLYFLQIPAASFVQQIPGTAVWGPNFYVYTSDALVPADLLASVILPTGASIVDVGLFWNDTLADGDGSVELWAANGGSPNGAPVGTTLIQSVSSSGSAGFGYSNVSINPPYVVHNDVANDQNGAQLFLVVHLPAGGLNGVGFKAVEIDWQRPVSPSPATATFNDVPTGHPFFQFIEALAASGITAGCGSGNFCPDASLTRGQMAVFFSKALGLYWPH